jgi:hypothetical protein
MAEGTSLALLLEASKIYGPISFVLVAMLILLFLYLRQQQKLQLKKSEDDRKKTDADRKEHMEKWTSMMSFNSDSMKALAESHRESIKEVICANNRNIDKTYELYHRQSEASEAMAHSLAQITAKLQHHKICPIEEKNHG